MNRSRPAAAIWLFDVDLGKQGNIGRLKKQIHDMEYYGGCGEAPTCGVSSRRRERGGVQRRMWRGPVHCVFVVATSRHPARGLHLVVPLCRAECSVCSGTTAKGSAWQ
uniref:Uncharacterized protein n=1 Tax=Setaria viridis TaxID=4556 RepID=A0A4U6VWE8_SETVI|nr:hypothetical protein SEVIR_2G159918v2 [Setaria viridis]